MLNLVHRINTLTGYPVSDATDNEDFPLSLEEVKNSAGLKVDDDDDEIRRLMRSALEFLEDACDKTFVPSVWKLTLPAFPWGAIYLPKPPHVDVWYIKYYKAGVLTDWSSDEYRVMVPDKFPAWIEPVNFIWPNADCRSDAVQVTFQAGSFVPPEQLGQAICLKVQSWYDLSEDTSKIDNGINNLITGLKQW